MQQLWVRADGVSSMLLKVDDPSLKRNVGKYHLPHVWDEVLGNTSELKLK